MKLLHCCHIFKRVILFVTSYIFPTLRSHKHTHTHTRFSILSSCVDVPDTQRRLHTPLISAASRYYCRRHEQQREILASRTEGKKKTFLSFYVIVLLCSAAPYEICPEDYAVSMVWRRTPSGELAFNRCPPNATGTDMSNDSHSMARLLPRWPSFPVLLLSPHLLLLSETRIDRNPSCEFQVRY